MPARKVEELTQEMDRYHWNIQELCDKRWQNVCKRFLLVERRTDKTTVELQWLEHGWLVYHGCFELVLKSLGKKSHSCRIRIIWSDFLFHYKNGILCVHIRIASMRRF